MLLGYVMCTEGQLVCHVYNRHTLFWLVRSIFLKKNPELFFLALIS